MPLKKAVCGLADIGSFVQLFLVRALRSHHEREHLFIGHRADHELPALGQNDRKLAD